MINWQPTQLAGRNINYWIQCPVPVQEQMACVKKHRTTWLFAEIIFNLKITEVPFWVLFLQLGRLLTVESSVGGEGVCGFVLTKQFPYRYLWANANTKGSRGLLLKAIPLQNYERLANVPLRSMENHQAERKKKNHSSDMAAQRRLNLFYVPL